MLTLAYLAPLLLVLLLLGSGRVGILLAGFLGLCAACAAAIVSPTGQLIGKAVGTFMRPAPKTEQARELLLAAWLAREGVIGAWLAWHVVIVVTGGIFLWRCLEATSRTDAASAPLAAAPVDGTALHRKLWFATFLLGPFTESVTGFGVGCIIALAFILGLGLRGLPALLLALFSQMLVPWGALAIGTVLGASLASIGLQDLGFNSAVIQGPMLLLYLVLFWWLLGRAGVEASAAQKLDDLGWTVALAGLLLATNRWIEIEIAGATAVGILLVLRWLRDSRPDRAAVAATLRAVWPYVLLVALLLASRLVPPLRDALRGTFAIDAFGGTPVFSPLYTPATFLFVVGIVVLLWRSGGRALPVALRRTLASAWRPVLVTLLFVMMARIYGGSGMAVALADALHSGFGRAALLVSPLFAAIGGFLTASNAGANAMLMPLQAALAQQASIEVPWLAALQNTVGSNLTMLSPPRVALGLAMLAGSVREADVYRGGWMLSLPALAVGVGGAALLLIA